MTVRATIPTIAVVSSMLAACWGCAPLKSGPVAAVDNFGAPMVYSRDNPASEVQIVPVANDDDDGPLEKFSNGMSNMGHSIKRVFTRKSQKSTNYHPQAQDDSISLSKPAQPKADFYVSLAHISERGGNNAAAAEQYKKALEIDPNDLAALMGLARLHDRQGELAEAMTFYKRAVASHPKEALVFNNQGLCLAQQEKYTEAIASLRKAVELRCDKVLYRNNLATVQVETGQIDEALATLSKTQGESVAHYNVGFLLNQRGKTAEALEQFKLAVAADDSFDAARQWVDKLSTKLASESPASENAGKPNTRVVLKQPGGFPSKPQTAAVAVKPVEPASVANDESRTASSPAPSTSKAPAPAASTAAGSATAIAPPAASATAAVPPSQPPPPSVASAAPKLPLITSFFRTLKSSKPGSAAGVKVAPAASGSPQANSAVVTSSPPTSQTPAASSVTSTPAGASQSGASQLSRSQPSPSAAVPSPAMASPASAPIAAAVPVTPPPTPAAAAAPAASAGPPAVPATVVSSPAASVGQSPTRLVLPAPPQSSDATVAAGNGTPPLYKLPSSRAQPGLTSAPTVASKQQPVAAPPPTMLSPGKSLLTQSRAPLVAPAPPRESPVASQPAVETSKPNDTEPRRSNPPAMLAQRVTRLPPTPDQIDEYSRAAPAVDLSKSIVPLPPVDPSSYPPSRY